MTHGESGGGHLPRATHEYRAWCGMVARCHVPTNRAYPRYGGRGVAVCERWRVFENFLSDMGRKTSPAHTLDRIDNAKGYRPGNCRWATTAEQARNRRSCRIVTFRGAARPMTDWANEVGISVQLLSYRLRAGWPVERAITTPPRRSAP